MEKKILFFTGMRSRKFGAIETYFLNVCRLMRQNGYQSIFQYEEKPESNDYLRQLVQLDAMILSVSINDSYFAALNNCCIIVRKYRPEIIVSNFEKTVLCGAIAGSIFYVQKKIAIVREIYKMKQTSILRKTGYHLYDKILCVSNAARKEIVKGGVPEHKVFTHYMGIFGDRNPSETLRSNQRKKYNIPETCIVIACIAFDKPIKGLDMLLEAFRLIYDEIPELYLFIIGVDPLKSELLKVAEEKGIKDRVCWPGIVDNAWKLLNISDFYIQPSRNEGLPSALVEAMALRKPVVGTPVGGIKEIVINDITGILASDVSPDAIAKAIVKMINMKENWETYGKNGQALYMNSFRGEMTSRHLVESYLL